MPKVFVINNATHDYNKAEKFGELINVTEGKMPIFKTDVMKEIFVDSLKSFTDNDYLLISGPAIMCIMAYQVVYEMMRSLNKATIKLLVFDAKEQEYIVRHLTIGQ
jgi:NAD(P)H-flavin reductase